MKKWIKKNELNILKGILALIVISSIVITTINAIIEFDPESIYYEDLNNRILIEKLKDDDITNKLINNMIELLEELEKSYKDNIKIIRR